MILAHGEIIDTSVEAAYLDKMYENCVATLNKDRVLSVQKVINACDILYKRAMNGEYDELAIPLLTMANISYERFISMARLFSREELEYKCKIELGEGYNSLDSLKNGTRRMLRPLGILFHIAAGNVDGLPAYSVIEGLLAGNINILKLPASDNGLSVTLLSELIKIEPDIKDYIYVFDVPSTEIVTLKRFAHIADAVVVWGGDEAVEAAKNMTDTKTKIIAWGHKLSFAYVTTNAKDEELANLAFHICETNQVLCSSCQGIFVDTQDEEELRRVGLHFFELLKEANKKCGKTDIGMRGKNTIRLYNDRLEGRKDWHILNEDGVSVIIKQDSELELSYMFRSLWIKKLPREQIIGNLKKHKGHLQTCGLLCSDTEKEQLVNMLSKAGLVRITGGHMSRMYPGEAHDGCYPLREYSRIVEID
ncbi:MAG: acyl-CoA reductase [Lachnospira sp.]|nr:acyl-CoA reductase [Lachnospira sp.]